MEPTLPSPLTHSIAQETLNFASKLGEQAEMLSAHVRDRLHPIMRQDGPTEQIGEKPQEQEYPPLFAELRTKFQVIKRSLDDIESSISRSEV